MEIKITYLSTRSNYSLVIQIRDKTYVFNLFEGFQRYCIESKMPLGSITTVFATSMDNIHGLIGFYLTMGDCEKESIELVNGFNIPSQKILKIANRPGLKFFGKKRTEYEDEHVKVELAVQEHNEITKEEFLTNVLITMPTVRGTLDASKLPADFPKSEIKRLLRGEKIIYNGLELNRKDFCSEDVDIPNILLLNYLEETEKNLDFIERANVILLKTEEHWKRVRELNKSAKLIRCQKNEHIEFVDQYKQLEELNSEIKPQTTEIKSIRNLSINLDSGAIPSTLTNGDTLWYSKAEKSLRFNPSITERHLNASQNVFPSQYLLFLGTACAVPSKYRNVSSFLYLKDSYGVLFDCGEDTIGQLIRAYGNTKICENVRTIVLSHSHPDHILGIVSVIKNTPHRLDIIGSDYIDEYLSIFDIEYNFINITSLDNSEIPDFQKYTLDNPINNPLENKIFRYKTTEASFEFIKSDHHVDSFFCSMIHKGTKISYSGDCRPSRKFSQMASESDVMIHECTFLHDRLERAIKTKHTTDVEAHKVFLESGSKILIQTHFSQRDGPMTWQERERKDNVVCAHDFYVHKLE